MEKHGHLPPPASTAHTAPGPRRGWVALRVALCALLAMMATFATLFLPTWETPDAQTPDAAHCPVQPAPLHPPTTISWTNASRAESLDLFSAAVRIPTQSYDDNGEPDEDPRWAPFYDFIDWLEDAFPVAWQAANVEIINSLGILATFQGSDESLKPLLLMSHYDVVPVPEDTFDRWTHGPFSGDLADGWVWGRGTADDKSLLVSQWEAMTHLLSSGWKPRRTVILTHGFDEEEVHARRGQGQIAPFLEDRYGHNGLLMVVDEGSGIADDLYGTAFALVGTGEKGYLDIVMRVGTDGGHSSVPPPHTGIGIMSQLVNALEKHPFETKLTPHSPLLQGLACVAKAKDAPNKWKKLLRGPKGWTKLAHAFANGGALQRALVRTTTAVDVIRGGVKVNALPELVEASVNFRIDFSESLASTKERVAKIAAKVAKKNGLEFRAWSGEGDPPSGRFVTLEVLGVPLEPAPNTPTSGGVWDLFAGTVRAAMGEELVVAPFATTGNTDCKMYYNLTRNVFRFMAASMDTIVNVHTVDERMKATEHHRTVEWIHALIQNADAYDGAQ